MSALLDVIAPAFAARTELLDQLQANATDCYRLFHGTVEGRPGLTVDRYGKVLLVQSFHQPLAPDELAALGDWYRRQHPVFQEVVYNDRSGPHSRIRNELEEPQRAAAEAERIITELSVRYAFRARHRGQDPWLFLDLRAGRRFVQQQAHGRSVLNLFAYTCGVGICAAQAGAHSVLNVDFAASSLDVGRRNVELNGVEGVVTCLQSDFFPAARQLAGLGLPQGRHGRRLPATPRLEPEQFELVFLDPPRYAKSPFGIVDLVHDYGSVFKPSLLATQPGGLLICCNNVAEVDLDDWLSGLQGSAKRNGRPLRDIEVIRPDGDFPSPDGRPPLKIAVLSV